MKMQEVILRLRELAPEAEQNVDLAIKEFYVMQDLLNDLQACVSPSTRAAVLKLIDERKQGLANYLTAAQDATNKLQKLNESYKEKLGPRVKKSQDLEGQQMLPGFEDECETPITRGETETMGKSSGMSAQAPAWTTSGRHG